jgi:hypothetical protein
VTAEEPLLLDPAVDDPEVFIGFREEVPYAIDGNVRGRTTIEVLKLERPELAEKRWDRLEKVKALRIVAESDAPDAAWARNVLQRMQQDGEEYASMTRAALR